VVDPDGLLDGNVRFFDLQVNDGQKMEPTAEVRKKQLCMSQGLARLFRIYITLVTWQCRPFPLDRQLWINDQMGGASRVLPV
jgi:hypothetical protein